MIGDLLQESKAYLDFKKDLSSDKISHAYLFLGEDKLARREYMRLFASTILCRAGGCGVCDTCDKIYNDAHLGVHYYNLDGKMNVKLAEKLIEESYKSSWEGNDIQDEQLSSGASKRIFFVDNFDATAPQVQNKLLKIFEEPPKNVIIALFASSDYAILQTIKSRAKLCYLPKFTSEDIHNELVKEGYPRSIAEIASALSDGSFEKAYMFVEDDSYYNQYSECFEVLKNCKNSTMVVDFIGKPIFSKENIGRTLEFLSIILRDVAIKVSGAKTPYTTRNRDYDIQLISEGYTMASIAMAILEVNQGQAMLNSYVSATTVAERVLFKILEAKYKWQ
ncbi:MAG: hypothetical protein IKL86_04715 [Clostridia bacterium]|nr:hypothetical protein [Clostridia bacterium]